jgi:predicted MFS family arabinose efflux permease
LWANVRAIAGVPYLRGALFTVFASSLLCAQLVTFSPILVRDVFHGDASHFSIAVGAFGVGGLIGATALLFVNTLQDRRRISSWSAAAYGGVLVLAALNPWYWGLPALLVVAGGVMSVSNISANTLIQTHTPARLRGQAVSLFMLAMRGGLSIGALAAGATVSLLGVTEAILINGVLAVLVQAVIGHYWFRASLPELA